MTLTVLCAFALTALVLGAMRTQPDQAAAPTHRLLDSARAGTPSLPASDVPAPATVPSETPVQLDYPPEVSVEGVAGEPVTWCYGKYCVDGAHSMHATMDLPAAPRIGAIASGADMTVESVTIIDEAGAQVDVEVDSAGHFSLPEGNWERLLVSVEFLPRGDGLYVWRLE